MVFFMELLYHKLCKLATVNLDKVRIEVLEYHKIISLRTERVTMINPAENWGRRLKAPMVSIA